MNETVLNKTNFLEVLLTEINTIPPNLTLTKQTHKTQLLLYDILIPALGCVIIVLNLIVVVSSGLILKKGSQPRSTYLFLGNVALCDLVTGIAVLLGQFYPKEIRNHMSCSVTLGLIVSSTITSIYSVGLIAIDRYLYIIHGMQYQRWVYPTRARLLIVFTWIIGGVIGFLPIMGWSGDTLNGKICWFIRLVPPNLIMMTCIVGLIPIIIVVVLYSIILYRAIKKVIQLRKSKSNDNSKVNDNELRINVGGNQREIEKESNQENSSSIKKSLRNFFTRKQQSIDKKMPSKTKAVVIVLLVTGSFVVTWVPYFVTSFIYIFCDPKETPEKCRNLQIMIASPLAILGFCNSLLNPIIYAWWHKGFRGSFKKIILKINKTPKSSTETKSTNSTNNKKKDSNILKNVQLNIQL